MEVALVQQTEFKDLPCEIKESIFTYLSQAEQKTAREVNKEWQAILDWKFAFNLTLDDKHLQLFKAFDENRKIDELVVKNFQTPLVSKSSTRSGLNKNIRCLVLGGGSGFPGDLRRDPNSPYTVANWRESTLHESVDYGISPSNMKILLQMNPDIEVLRVSGAALSPIPRIPSLKGVQLDRLTVLDINFGNAASIRRPYIAPNADPYIKLLQNHFPSLHTLNYSSISWKVDFRLWVAVFQCVAENRKTLKNLKIFHTTVYSLPNSLESGKWFPLAKYEELRSKIREVKLNFLLLDLLKCGPNFGLRWRTLEKDLLEAQKDLVDFVFIGNARETVDFNYSLMLNTISHTISNLEIFWHCLIQPPFDCASLRRCTNLKTLKLNIQRTGYQIFDPFEKFFLNMSMLPTTIENLLCGQLIKDSDALWISKNMLNLKEIGYASLRHTEETQRTLEHFLVYLSLPKLKVFRINNFRCPRISRFVDSTVGLHMSLSNQATLVSIDRKILQSLQLICFDIIS